MKFYEIVYFSSESTGFLTDKELMMIVDELF